mmetsp:Transcript_2757/g.3402  ORF Transcript_2757/g.3402 Transcript_2757/m.3402 type:complete len:449 (+) Transcript_2757:566-1912(+)
MKYVSVLSASRAADKFFFVPFCATLASACNDPQKAEKLVEEGLLAFLENAVSTKPSEKTKILSEVTNVQLASFQTGNDAETLQAKQFTYREVSRVIGNIAHVAPHLGPVIIEQGALDLLQAILESARSATTIQHISRAIANLSANEHTRQAIIDAGWVGILEHWISAECQRSVTSRAKMSATELLTKDSILKGASFNEIEEESKSRRVTAISLLALGNLASTERKVADHFARTTVLRELMDTITSNPSNLLVNQQAARALAAMASHFDSNINKRIQSLVGIEGLTLLVKESKDESVQFNVSRCLASLVMERPFAKLIESQDPLGWELIEELMKSSSLPVQRQITRAVANLSSIVGGKKLLQKKGLKQRLEVWSKSNDAVLSENAIRALASLMGSKVSNAKYAEGVHLLHPGLNSDQFAKDNAKFDIVLVHGVGGDPLGTWRAGDNHQG